MYTSYASTLTYGLRHPPHVPQCPESPPPSNHPLSPPVLASTQSSTGTEVRPSWQAHSPPLAQKSALGPVRRNDLQNLDVGGPDVWPPMARQVVWDPQGVSLGSTNGPGLV
ncbi:hypothetical protein ACOMHN_061633 [Nucella lapillus]